MWRKQLRLGATITVILMLALTTGWGAIGEQSSVANLKAKVELGRDLSTQEKVTAEELGLFESRAANVNPVIFRDSRTAVLDESFEGIFPPDGWVAITTDTGGDGWGADMGSTHGPGSVADGSYAAMADIYWMSTGTVANLTSPAVDLSTLTAPELRFWVQGMGGTDPDPNLTVNISTDAGVSWTELYNQDADGSIDAWGQVIIDLTTYAAETAAMFDFVATSDYGLYNIFVDAVTIDSAPIDPVVALSSDSLGFGGGLVGMGNDMVLTITNVGGADLNISSIIASDDAFTVDVSTGVVAVNASMDVTVTFSPFMAIDYAGTLTITSDAGSSPDMVDLTGFGAPTAGGPDLLGYAWTNNLDAEGPTFSWIDSVGSTSAGIANGDDYRGTIDLPFEFRFYNNYYTQITGTTNGWVGMGPSSEYTSSFYINEPILDTSTPNNVIAPFWDDLKAGGTYHGTMVYKTVGTEPNRQFVLIWQDVYRTGAATDDYYTFELILHEGTSNITFQYLDAQIGNGLYDYGKSATIGIENSDGSDGLEYSYNGVPQLIYDGMAIEFVAPPEPQPEALPVLISEIVVTPTAGEYIEIFNPYANPIDLTNYYLTDATYSGDGTYYYNITTGAGYGGGAFGDWHARFPADLIILPGEYMTISLAGSDDFFAEYGIDPDLELFEDGDGTDLIPEMLEAMPGSINGQGSLTNSDEVVILYHWDGVSDLVQDSDYLLYDDGGDVPNEAVDKSGVTVGSSTYLNDTPIVDQVAGVTPGFGYSLGRVDYLEGMEVLTGGNGITGHDETSEDVNATFAIGLPSPGAEFRPADFNEPNDDLTTATVVVDGDSLLALIDPTDDLDFYTFTLTETVEFNIHMYVNGFSSLDPEIRLFDADSVSLANADNGASGSDESLTGVLYPGTYYLVAGYWLDVRAETGAYAITFDFAPYVVEPGETCQDPILYQYAGDPAQTGAIESYGAVWYSVETSEHFDSLYVSLCGSDYDTKLEVWAACDDGSYLAYNDDDCGLQSQIELLDVAPGIYKVKVYGYSSASGNYALNIWGANGIAPGSTCDTAIPVVSGTNEATGADQWFAFTATMDGVVKVSSQNEAGDAPWDTYLFAFDSCDPEAEPIAINDDCCGYWGPSTVEFLGTTGMTYYIFWQNSYEPGPFTWMIDEVPNAPSNLMAEGHDGFNDLYWMPPVGAIGARAGIVSIAATNDNYSVTKLAGMKATAQEMAVEKRLAAPGISDLTQDQILNIAPVNRHLAITNPVGYVNSGLRNIDVTISVTVDGFPGEASWNLWDYTLSAYYYAEDQLFTAGGENQTVTVSLADGNYSVDCFDSFGDGGVAGVVTLGDGTVIESWADDAYLYFGEFGFTVLEGGIYGCMDPEASNYNPDATVDDGSCVYEAAEGEDCTTAFTAVAGANTGSGATEWFEYTATMDGEITVSSQNEAGDAAWDTNLLIFASCDPDALPIASNDDCCGYWGPSTASFLSTSGMTYYIVWPNDYEPGPFDWTLDEHEVVLCDDTIIPEGVAEVEPNGGMNSDPVEYDPRVCGDLITGTYFATTETRDTDWFNFTLTEHASIEAFVDVSCGDPMIFILDEAVNIIALGADNGEGLGEALMTEILPPGDYWFWVGSQVFDGDGTEYNYNAGFVCTPQEPTSYTVYRDGTELATDIFSTHFTDGGVSNGTEYCYTVTATMDGVETAHSNEACATPNQFFPEPMGLMAAAFDGTVDLQWAPPFPMGQLAMDDGTAESWYWVGGPSILDHMFYSRLMIPSDGEITHIAIWDAADELVNWNAIYVTGDDGSGVPDLANTYAAFVDVPVSTPIGAGGEWTVLELTTPAAVTGGQAMYIVTQWPDASDVGPFVATDDDTDLGNAAWSNTGGASWNSIAGTFIMRAYMQTSTTRENIEITSVPRDVSSNLPVISLDENKVLRGKRENISLALQAPSLQSNAMRDLTGYQVYRGTAPGELSIFADNITETMFTDPAATNGTAYYYAVTALYDGVNESGFSNEVMALPLGAGGVPYANNFDETNGGFFGGGEWQWGAPSDPPGSSSAPNVWATVLNGPYSNGMTSFLELPFDLSGSPYGYELSFMHSQDIEEDWDYGYVAVDHDGDGFYDILGVYTGVATDWMPESVIIPAELTSAYTKVAFIFQSDGSVTQNGWYIDDVALNEFLPAIMTATPDAIADALEVPASSTHDLVIGNVGGLDLEYFGMVEYIDGVTLDTLFFDNFDAGIGAWTVVDGLADGNTWYGEPSGSNLDGTPQAIVDSDMAGSVDMDEELISPMIDTEGALSLTLEWDQYFNAYSGNEIGDVDVWNGIEWVNVFTTSEDLGYWLDPDHPVLDITGLANADLQVRFHYYNANYEWYWAVDNVLITVEEGTPWITVDGGVAFDGMIPVAGADLTHLVSLSSDGLTEGTYNANIWLFGNGGETVVPVQLIVTEPVSADANQIPETYALDQNYPNPFNPVTSIKYQLPEAADVRIIVYNVLGQKVATLIDQHKAAGYHSVMWSGTNDLGTAVSSGVYLYRIESENFSDVKKLMLLK